MRTFLMDHKTDRVAHRIEGRPAAPGIALAPLVRLAVAKSESRRSSSKDGERRALADALETSKADLIGLMGKVADDDAEAILSFQVALLEDENLAAPAFAGIADGKAAHQAWYAAIDPEIASFEQAEDPY